MSSHTRRVFFFFQAEDGIRDLTVTGVQTCALPIYDENWLALFYGAALLGAVTVPVNTRFKAAEIDFCLKQADCKALFYVERFLKIDFGAMVREIRPRLAVEVNDLSGKPFAGGEVAPQDL